jgi:hypothetical protein
MGHLCGYVAVGKDHPCFGLGYDDERVCDLSAHGGLTYAREREGGDWWFGFDAAHASDATPVYGGPGVYRAVEYMRGECESLAAQLAKMTEGDRR